MCHAGRVNVPVAQLAGLAVKAFAGLVKLQQLTSGVDFQRVRFGHGALLQRDRGVDVGEVEAVTLDQSLSHVNVTARLNKPAAGLAREGSEFWIVEPRISVDQVTGLQTLLSGSYIEVSPGSGMTASSGAAGRGWPVAGSIVMS